MEFILFVWEKSERIYLTLFLAIMSLLATWYVHHEASRLLNPHDLLDGTLIQPLNWVTKGMWFVTLVALVVHAGRCIWLRLFKN